MPNWVQVLSDDLLSKAGKKAGTTRELANAASKILKEPVSVDALFNAHKRHKDKLKLRESLTDYMAEAEAKEPKKKPLKPEDIYHELPKEVKKNIKKSNRFIITSAMNNVRVDPQVWGAIKTYADHNDAQIIVVPVRYKNPTSQAEATFGYGQEDAWWDDPVLDYTTDQLIKLHEHLWVMGHVRVQATAVTPLSGLEALSSGASAIFGHSQLAMQMVATPQNKLPKVMYTTGSCTKSKYSRTKAGVKAGFHHVPGAVVVETDGPRFYIRAVTADKKGGFYDLDKYYSADGVSKSEGVLALVTGDEHAMFSDTKCRNATYLNKDSIASVLKPKKVVRHDVFDGYSISHHNRKDPVVQYSKHSMGHQKVENELQLTLEYIESTTPKGAENVIVSSNHHDHLLRWLKDVHAPKEEPWNARAWLQLWLDLTDTVEWKERGVVHSDPLALWMENRAKVPIRFLGPDSDERVADIAIGMHGHNGINGSRGTLNQFAKIGVKTIVGHSHTPGIKHGCYQVGTSSTLRMEYTKGPSSWAHAHAVVHPNGKRQMIFVVDGHWRLQGN